jgi:polyferredoxin
MMLSRVRSLVQHVGFLVMIYGGRIGIHLGPAVPCFACPFVSGCGGYCYLMGLQGYIGFGMTAVSASGAGLIRALGWFVVFVLSVAVLGKLWCGWLCPFGLISDWLSSLRRKLGIRETEITPAVMRRLATIKYGLLVYIAVIPPLVTMGLLHSDFYLPFCSICPGKSLLPLFVGETRYLALNFGSSVTLWLSVALLLITGVMLVGMFFKSRFFCVFCPLLALIHLLKPLTILSLVKSPEACIGCGNCSRACPMEIEEVWRERCSGDVQTDSCLDCGSCAEACPSNGALALKFLRFSLFSSSRKYVANLRKTLMK